MRFKSCVRSGIIVVLSASVPFGSVYAAGPVVKSLTLQEALRRGADASAEVRDAGTEIAKKKLELQQARFAVKSEEEKAAGPFAKPGNLSQDVQIRMKVPEAESGLFLAQEAYKQAAERTEYDVEKVYLQALQDHYAEQAAAGRYEGARKEADAVKTKIKYGFADAAAKEEADKKLEKAASEWKQAQLTAKASRLALGQKVQLTMEDPVQLEETTDYVDLSQKTLPLYIANAQKTDGTLLNDVEKLRLADEKLRVTQQLYTAKFGAGRMKALERMAKSKTPDAELFMAQYDATLEQIRQEWEGFFQLPGLFPIPKSLFQGERDGLRYLDDLRNGLPIALMEQGKAQLKEQESRAAVTDKVRQSYLEAKGAEESYAQALRDQEASAAKLDKVNAALKAGLLKTEDLQAAKDAQEQAKQQVLMAYIAYKVAVGKLDLDSGGAVSRTVRPGVLPYREVDSGLDAVKTAAEPVNDGTWELKPAVGTVLSELTLKTKGKLKATDYALFTAEGHPLGGRTPVGKPVRQLSLSFSEPSKLRVQLYSGNEVLGEAHLEGRGSSGELKLAAPEDAASGTPLPATAAPGSADGTTIQQDQILIGTYRMALDALTPEVYNAASATMAGSGQGVYFAPAWAEGAWFGLDQALDSSALTVQGPDSAALTPEQTAALQVTMELPAPGQLTTPLSAEQLQQSIAELNKAKEQLEASRQAAVEAHQPAAAAELDIQLKDAEAQIAMLDALSKGDTGTALQQMALVHNADALMAAIAAEDGGTTAGGGGSGRGGTDGGPSGSGTAGTGTNNGSAGTDTSAGGGVPGAAGSGVPTQAALEAEQQRSKQALQAALAAGDAASVLAQAQQLLAAAQRLAALEDGSADEQAALASAKSKLQAALAAAEQAHDAAQVETLARTLESVRQAAVLAEKDALFGKLDALEAAASELANGAPPEAGTPQEEARGQLDGYLMEQEAALLADIGKKELEKYSEAQLQALSAQADEVKAASEGAVPMPVQQLVSKDFQVVLDTPPILLDGRAYVPVRALSESFGASVDWDPERMAVTVSSEEGTAECTIGSTTAYVDGAAVEIDAPPVLISGYTYVPLRFIGETIGLQIQWYEAAGTIQISKP